MKHRMIVTLALALSLSGCTSFFEWMKPPNIDHITGRPEGYESPMKGYWTERWYNEQYIRSYHKYWAPKCGRR